MRPILILAPYILIPLIAAILYRRSVFLWKGWTYIGTAVIIFLYPFVFIQIDNYFNPPSFPECNTGQSFFLIGSIFIFLPATLLLQAIFNEAVLKNKDKTIQKIETE